MNVIQPKSHILFALATAALFVSSALAQPASRIEPLALDLIALAEKPLEDMRTLQDPLLIVSNGRVVLDRLNFGKK